MNEILIQLQLRFNLKHQIKCLEQEIHELEMKNKEILERQQQEKNNKT